MIKKISVNTQTFHPNDNHTNSVTCLIQMKWDINTTTLVSSSLDKTLKIWNVETLKQLDTLYGHENGVLCLFQWKNTYNKETITSGSADQTVKFWNIKSKKDYDVIFGRD